MKMRHDFFKFYLCRLFTYKLDRCNENCNEIQTFKYLLLKCHHYFNEQEQVKKNMKNFISLRTLFNTNANIKNVLNYIKKHSSLYEKINSKHREERKDAQKEVKKSRVDRDIRKILENQREKENV